MFRCEFENSTATLHLQHGKVNAFDVEFLEAFIDQLNSLESSPATCVILSASGNTFSAGVDLFRLLQEGEAYVRKFVPLLSKAFERLFIFPKPVVAAVNGHAIAGGCVITCACDFTIMADLPVRIGVPELLVGVPFPAVALEIMRFAVPRQYLQEVIYTGKTYFPTEALTRGLIDEIAPAESLLLRAREIGQELKLVPPKSFQTVKGMLRAPSIEQVRRFASEDEKIIEIWKDPEIHRVISNYLDRTVKKRSL